jgi:glycosyltransferase involved in cell wall biosynthesis
MVSIIVPSFNQGAYLQEALDSVINQTYPDWECIIINDGSTDNTEEVAKYYCGKDIRFKYIYQENQGIVAARNNAIHQSCGDYILPLDGDDKIAPVFLELAVESFKKNPHLKLCCSDVEFFGSRNGIYLLPEYSLENLITENCFVCTCMFKKSDYNMTTGYNPNMSIGLEDWDFRLSLLETGGEVYKIPKVLFYYRIKSNSRNTSVHKNMQQLRYNIWLNHKELFSKVYFDLTKTNEYKFLKHSYDELLDSKSYRLGHLLLSPFRLLKKAF